MNGNSLLLRPCEFKAAKYAVMNWHYSKSMPAGKLVKFGVWEDEKFIGAVIFGRGANNNAAKSFNLTHTECCELVRVALGSHKTPVTRIIRVALLLLKKYNPGIKLVFSYADKTNQNHKGIIYRAGNWIYLGERVSKNGHVKIGNKLYHNRSLSAKYGSRRNVPEEIKKIMKPVPPQIKHLFVYILDDKYKLSAKGVVSDT